MNAPTELSFAPVNQALLTRVMAPYFANARLVENAVVYIPADNRAPSLADRASHVAVKTECEIKTQLYGDGGGADGHITTAELNLVYNQLLFVALSSCAEAGHHAIGMWDVEEFFRRQINDVLIVEYNAKFDREISRRLFHAHFSIHGARPKTSRRLQLLATRFEVMQDEQRKASAEVTVALRSSS